MITSDQVRTVVDRAVCDNDGNKIGSAKHVFLDDVTGMPEWVSVKTGLFGTSESFVPIRDASMVGDHLEVPFAKDTVKKAPNVDVDAGGHLSVEEEHRLYEYYGIDWDAAWQQADQAGREQGNGGRAASGTAAGTAAAAGAATAGTASAGGAAGTAGAAGAMGAAGAAGAARTGGTAKKGTLAEGRGVDSEEAMTRSEERMRVGTERRESGRARLRKYVVTEEQEQTVPLRHEEVHVVREPITEADRGAAASGVAITEEEREVTLHEERPVTQIETVPVERVRLTTEEVTEQQTVKGKVRKERIVAETDADKDSDR